MGSQENAKHEDVKTGKVWLTGFHIIGAEIATKIASNSVEKSRGNKSIYLHRSGSLLENGLDRPESCYGRYGFGNFPAFPYLL